MRFENAAYGRMSAMRLLVALLIAALALTLAPALAWAAPGDSPSVGPLRIFCARDNGPEVEVTGTGSSGVYKLDALGLDPSTFETLHLRVAAADGFSFDEGVQGQITNVSVNLQATTADGIIVANGFELRDNGDGSRSCAIPATLLRSLPKDDYDCLNVTWKTTKDYPYGFGTYWGRGFIAAGPAPAYDVAPLEGTYRSERGAEVAIVRSDATWKTSIGDEVTIAGEPAFNSFNDVVDEYDASGQLARTSVRIGCSASARFAPGVNEAGERTLTAIDDYAYRTAQGATAGSIAKGEVFTCPIVAHIDDRPYSTLQDAFAAAGNGDVITIAKDFTIHGVTEGDYTAGKTITIDLGGHTLTADSGNGGFRIKSGDVTFRNGTIQTAEGTFCTVMGINSKITLDGLVLKNSTKNGNGLKAFNNCTMNIEGCTVISRNGGGVEATGGTVNIVGSSFSQTGFFDWNSTNVAASNGGVVNVHDGTFTSENYGAYVFNSGGTINIEGGTFTAGKAVLKADVNTGASAINVAGGTFAGGYEIVDGALLAITGGGFDADPSAFVDDDHTVTKSASGRYTVAPRAYALSYDLAGGALPALASNPTSYTFVDDAIVLVNPERPGFAFVGWTGTDIDGSSLSVTIPSGSRGDRSYKAMWRPVTLPDASIEVEEPDPDSVTVPTETLETVSRSARSALEQIKAGETPASMAAADAEKIKLMLASAMGGDEVSVVLSVSADPVREDVVVASEKNAIGKVALPGEKAAAYFDLKVTMTVNLVGKDGSVKAHERANLSSLDAPALFELTVDPKLIANCIVRIAHVHGIASEIILPENIDRERGAVSFHAQSFSTFALLTADTVTVSFESNGGTDVNPQTVRFGTRAAKPADPVREGYVFAGWFLDEGFSTAFDFSQPLESSITLYAKWTEKQGSGGSGSGGTPGVEPEPPSDEKPDASGNTVVNTVVKHVPSPAREKAESTFSFLSDTGDKVAAFVVGGLTIVLATTAALLLAARRRRARL